MMFRNRRLRYASNFEVVSVAMTVVVIVLAAIIIPAAASTFVYAQNKNNTHPINYSNTTLPPIKGLNANTIIDAINDKIRSIYDGYNMTGKLGK
jgi:hypothetical protein